MQEIDLHDLSDDADYADSLQQGASSLTPSDSSKRSSASEPDGAEVVYLKDNVSIHPTQYASERISGRLRLIKQGSYMFMTWIPYKGQSSNARLSERDRNLYTIRAVPFTDVRSIRRHTPTIGWQYIIVVLSSGLAFPPLYFYNGGVRDFLATVKQHAFLVRSAEDANVFLVNDFQDPLQRTLSSLELRRDVSVANRLSSAISAGESPSNEYQQRTEGGTIDGSATDIQHNRRQRQKAQDPARDLSIQVLEKFSRVTRLARETTSQLFRESHSDGFGGNESKNHNLTPHQYPSNVSSIDSEKVPSKIPVASDPLEKTSSRKRNNGEEAATNVGTLFSCFPLQSISTEQAKRFTKFRERKGLIEKDVVRTDRSLSFYDGDDNSNVNLLRDILLTYSFYNFDLGYCQGMSDLLSPILFIMRDESESFWCFVALMERLGPNFNRDQNGMHSQLFALSKLVELLDIPLHNYFEQNDCLNYFFCFRWVLIQFKREFEFDRTMRLWEVLWTHYLSEHLHLYFCIAILKRYRQKIIGEEMDFDTLLKFINELSGHIDLNATLRDAEALCICAGENGAARIPPGTPPSLPTEVGLLYTQQDDDVL
ncbi:TBC1 domain family member 15 like [Actinidia chinensis var. chinensis]|uniref:TBC1 domain family member 15 n=1 Tax=Actinidia chinensis var. chinensis TaxID=1590841 RepID=A0A2R6P2M4_ACTCC|nr:TBC1 domain family member 15 like [Actinidia chinensis var. chinensis]